MSARRLGTSLTSIGTVRDITCLWFMPRYYFDFRDDEAASLDQEGIDLRNVMEAQEEAALALADFARDTLAAVGAKSDRELSVSVRDERGTIFRAKCVFGYDRFRN
ncbi:MULTISPECIES: DUF6894 family protein [unclassified Bradyrhizobium]